MNMLIISETFQKAIAKAFIFEKVGNRVNIAKSIIINFGVKSPPIDSHFSFEGSKCTKRPMESDAPKTGINPRYTKVSSVNKRASAESVSPRADRRRVLKLFRLFFSQSILRQSKQLADRFRAYPQYISSRSKSPPHQKAMLHLRLKARSEMLGTSGQNSPEIGLCYNHNRSEDLA